MQLGQSVVVENRPGSGTLVGTDAAAKAAPDGHTLLVGSVSNLVLNVGLYPSLPYEPQRDFEPIGIAVAYSYTLMGRKDLGLDTLADVLKQAKAKPRALTYASAGNGSGQHVLAAATWHSGRRGTGARAVPRRAGGLPRPARRPRRPVLRPGADRAHAGRRRHGEGAGHQRRAAQPDASRRADACAKRGVDLELESWFGLFAPARTPPAALARLRDELLRAARSNEVQTVFTNAGGRPLALNADDTRALLARDLQRWVPLVRAAGLKAD